MNASSYSVRIYLLIFRSDDSKCLDDPPTKREVISTQSFDIPGRLYDADQQCQLAYGQDSKYCHGDKFLDVSSDYEFTYVNFRKRNIEAKNNAYCFWLTTNQEDRNVVNSELL